MPRGRMSRFPRINESLRRRVSWASGPRGDVSLTTAGAGLFTTAAQATIDDLTIVRVRGELLVMLKEASTAGSQFPWAFGMCVVTENAFGVGVTAVPAPFTDVAWDGWLVHQQGVVRQELLNGPPDEANTYRAIIDSKAMRKTHATDVLIGIVEVHTESGTAQFIANLVSRHLSKLP